MYVLLYIHINGIVLEILFSYIVEYPPSLPPKVDASAQGVLQTGHRAEEVTAELVLNNLVGCGMLVLLRKIKC